MYIYIYIFMCVYIADFPLQPLPESNQFNVTSGKAYPWLITFWDILGRLCQSVTFGDLLTRAVREKNNQAMWKEMLLNKKIGSNFWVNIPFWKKESVKVRNTKFVLINPQKV